MKLVKESLGDKLKGPSEEEIKEKIKRIIRRDNSEELTYINKDYKDFATKHLLNHIYNIPISDNLDDMIKEGFPHLKDDERELFIISFQKSNFFVLQKNWWETVTYALERLNEARELMSQGESLSEELESDLLYLKEIFEREGYEFDINDIDFKYT